MWAGPAHDEHCLPERSSIALFVSLSFYAVTLVSCRRIASTYESCLVEPWQGFTAQMEPILIYYQVERSEKK